MMKSIETMAEQKSRLRLKSLFKAGKVPGEGDFSALIDSQLNSQDDKVERREDTQHGDSLAIGAGNAQALLSFFSTMGNSYADWVIKLGPDGRSLQFYSNQGTTPVFTLDSAGRVGIGTANPTAGMDVKGDMNVQGNATLQSLTIPGIGTLNNLNSLQKVLNLKPDGTSAIVKPATPDSEKTQPPPTEVQGDTEVKQDHLQGEVPAGKTWQNIAGPFTGYTALEVVAWVGSGNDKSICHATAVNIDGDPSDGAITHTQSYQGRAASKIYLRWSGDAKGYYLQCQTRLSFPMGTKIQYRIEEKK